MGLSRILLAFVCAMVLATTHFSRAQIIPQDYVDAHNAARAQVGVGPLSWDNTVAAFAQVYADQRADNNCSFVHSGGKYGENLAMGSDNFTGADAVSLWIAEKADYNYNTNTCAEGKQCGHYTQVVWNDTVLLGCARAKCTNGWWFITCNYSPPGNYAGQRPYSAGPEYSGNYLLTVGGGESGDYDCDTDSSARMEGKKSRHSQAVWRDSVQLGRASVLCTDGCYSVVCNYDPPGNYIGKRPYRLGQECSGNRLLVCRT